MNTKQYDLIVLGFGKAGKTLAAKFGSMGKTVAMIEETHSCTVAHVLILHVFQQRL